MISLKTRLAHQESTVEQLHKLRREMEEVFDKEKHILEVQIEQDKQIINQLELRIEMGRRSLQEAREMQAKAESDLLQVLCFFIKWDLIIYIKIPNYTPNRNYSVFSRL